MVRTAPASSGGANASAALRPGALNRATPAARALIAAVATPMARAVIASASQVRIQPSTVARVEANQAAARAVRPIRTMPRPGTAVKREAPSIVSRMKCRWSSALSWSAGGSSFPVSIGAVDLMR